jgi:hypothetical protein
MNRGAQHLPQSTSKLPSPRRPVDLERRLRLPPPVPRAEERSLANFLNPFVSRPLAISFAPPYARATFVIRLPTTWPHERGVRVPLLFRGGFEPVPKSIGHHLQSCAGCALNRRVRGIQLFHVDIRQPISGSNPDTYSIFVRASGYIRRKRSVLSGVHFIRSNSLRCFPSVRRPHHHTMTCAAIAYR